MEQLGFWFIFNVGVLSLLVLDLVVLNRKNETVTVKSALWWSAFWVGLAGIFNIFLYYWKGKEPAMNFLTGYLIEESLSVDNLFVFMLIFNYFKVPSEYQRKVLFWGIIGALVLRAAFILVGVSLINNFHWTVYILGLFLVITGIKMITSQDKEVNPEKNPIINLVNRFMKVTKTYEGDRFFVKKEGIWFATPLFIVVLVVETTDVVFAADSIPAILAITTDSFIVYTSNVFALLGLRSLYFALAGLMTLFHYINYGLAIILSFIGIKLLISGFYEIDVKFALLFVAIVLILSVIVSVIFPKKESLFGDKD
ncbi:MAG: TerC family protein [Cytophagaceae bacterium]|nr:TerC family protein [Cytophagaceae bacterium]